MIFDDDLLAQIKASPTDGVIAAIELARQAFSPEHGWSEEDYEIALELLLLLEESSAAGLIVFDRGPPLLNGNINDDCARISQFANGLQEHLQQSRRVKGLERARSRMRMSFGKAFTYEFSQGDLDRVQQLINELREQIATADFFEVGHQQRLLKRLEKLQAELHKKVADLDRFWGLMGDAGVALGKFGTDAKPIVDRIKELTQIVWHTQARSEELPSDAGFPSLENKPSAGPQDV